MALSTPDIPEPPKFGSLQFDKAFVRLTRQEGGVPLAHEKQGSYNSEACNGTSLVLQL